MKLKKYFLIYLIFISAFSSFCFADKTKFVAGGIDHLCSLSENGVADCWGNSSNFDITPPHDLGKVLSLSTYYKTVCVILENQKARCWGLINFVPENLGAVKSISAGERHVCAIRQDNTLKCWGDLKEPSQLPAVESVISGTDKSCAVFSDHSARCWGRNPLIETNLKIKYIAPPSYFHTCAILMDNTVKCWIWNSAWKDFLPPTDLGPVTDLAMGDYHSCALTVNGKTRCWGWDRHGETLPPEDQDIVSLSPSNGHFTCGLNKQAQLSCWGDGFLQPPAGMGKVKSIAGQHNTFCAIDSKNTPHCWGMAKLQVPENIKYAKKISVSSDVACIIDQDDMAQCWGANDVNQIEIPKNLGAIIDISLSGGGSNPCAVTSEGMIRCWGAWHKDTSFPQSSAPYLSVAAGWFSTGCGLNFLGKVTCVNNPRVTPHPVEYNFPQNLLAVKKLVMDSTSNSCVITQTDDLFCFASKNTEDFLPPPTDIGKVKDVSMGVFDTCVVTAAEGIRCWPHQKNKFGSFTYFEGRAKQVATGIRSGCAILETGFVKCWGYLMPHQN